MNDDLISTLFPLEGLDSSIITDPQILLRKESTPTSRCERWREKESREKRVLLFAHAIQKKETDEWKG